MGSFVLNEKERKEKKEKNRKHIKKTSYSSVDHMSSSLLGPCCVFMLLSTHSGGGSGIGRAVCQRLASEGASVVVADISEESANETLGNLSTDLRGQGHMAAVVDVSSKESIKKLVTNIQVLYRYSK